MRGRISYLAEAVRTAVANITNNKLRSFLTIGIVCLGITCLVGTQTAIECLSSLLTGAFGTSAGHITISSHKTKSAGAGSRTAAPLSYPEAVDFAARFGDNLHDGSISVYTHVPLQNGVGYGSGRLGPQTTVLAFSGDYFSCNALAIDSGREFTGADECVVGRKVARQLCRKGNLDSALGAMLYVGGRTFRVAGVLQEETSLLGIVTDNTVFIPLGAAVGSLVDVKGSYSIDLSVPKAMATDAAALAEATMRMVRHVRDGEPSGFEITEGSAAEREIDKLGGSLSGIALIIGLLTLLGASVALTNIMLISVAERTREVGLRRAVGASRSNIRDGFLAESLLICEAGCIIGTALGIVCGNGLGVYLHTGVAIPWKWIAISQLICLATGIAACTLPARRASRINVVEALRCE